MMIRDYFWLQLPQWEDLRFPAAAINPVGLTDDADRDNTYGWLLFDATNPEVAACQAQLPHAWKQGTVLKPHVHWMKSVNGAGGVYWQLQYRWCQIGQVMDGSWTTIGSSTAIVSDGNTAYKHALTELGTITTVGKLVSDMLVMILSRQPANAGDTYGSDAILLEFDIHYLRESLGSNYEYQKLRP